jgi:hypothetical protein
MTKGKSKSAAAHSVVKAAIGTAALLASGASAKGLRGESGAGGKEEVVVASFQISSKQGLNDEIIPPSESNLKVVERVVAETAPFPMNHLRKRSLEEVTDPPIDGANDGEKAKKKKDKQKKKDEKKDPPIDGANDGEKAKKKKEKKKKKDGKKHKKDKKDKNL